ncbi:MAG: PilW family protein [Gammaproteobacteria bacterium]
MKRSRGIALAELMVALAVGLGLVLAAATLQARISQLSRQASELAEAQDALRIALGVIEHDLRHAGFWGLVPEASAVAGRTGDAGAAPVSVISDCGGGWAARLERPLEVHRGGWALDCPPNGGAHGASHVLVLRRAKVSMTSEDAGILQLASDRWRGRLFADGSGMAGAEVEIRDLVARAYYVSRRSTADPSRPSLRRKTLQRGPRMVDEEVNAGIAAMTVELGVDGDAPGEPGHGLPDAFVAPGTPAAGDVVAVRVKLTAHGPDRLTAFRTVRLQERAPW